LAGFQQDSRVQAERKYGFLPHKIEAFEEHPILPKFKEGYKN
jgi:hypothetical protein